MSLHIHAPQPTEEGALVIDCPTCQRLRRAHYRLFEWYGALVTCAGCGDRWNDGEMQARPFAPGWRQANIRRARGALSALGVAA